jgi:hypothetical protein
MSIALIEQIEALVAAASKDEIQALPPIRRQRLTQALRYLADQIDPAKDSDPRASALAGIQGGERAEDSHE